MTVGLWLTAGAVAVSVALVGAAGQDTSARWWMREPIRFLQPNLSENDSTVDPKALVDAVARFGANTFLVNMGGIVAFSPTRVPFHYASAYLPAGRDLIGEAVRGACARIRVIGRFDLSKTRKAVFDAHPEWFFRAPTANLRCAIPT